MLKQIYAKILAKQTIRKAKRVVADSKANNIAARKTIAKATDDVQSMSDDLVELTLHVNELSSKVCDR